MKRLLSLMLLCALLLGSAIPALAGIVQYQTGRNLPDAMVGVHYYTRVKATGTPEPVITIAQNPYGNYYFPQGLSLDKDGSISGSPKKAGAYVFVLNAHSGTTDATQEFVINVLPFDEAALKQGGGDPDIVGMGMDDITGVANGINGGRVTMHGDTAFFVDPKAFLYRSEAPYAKASLEYKAAGYAWLDWLVDDIYYYHRYLKANTSLVAVFKSTYVTRIVRDPAQAKGRDTLVELKEPIADLSVTDTILLYIQNDHMMRASMRTGKPTTLRAYSQGAEIRVDHAFPFNGFAYFRDMGSKRLYRMPLDGQVAEPLTPSAAGAFTAAIMNGEPVLVFADTVGQVYTMPLQGGEASPVEGIHASALNADGQYVYFANQADKNRLYRLIPGSAEDAEKLGELSVDQIYVFAAHVAFEQAGGKKLYILPLGGGEAVKLGK